MDNIKFKEVNFHTQINTPEYINNQRLYTEIHYTLTQEEKYGRGEWQNMIRYYFDCLDKYNAYATDCEKHQKEMARETGYKMTVVENKNPDHTYASRMSGISSDYVLSQFQGYYYRSDASIKPKDDNQEWLDHLDWSMR